MKKLILIFVLLSYFLISCKKETREEFNIYVDKNIAIPFEKIINLFEKKNKDIKIVISTEKSENLKGFDLLISSSENIGINSDKNIEKENISEFINKNYKKEYFTEDNIVILGRKKINDFKELQYSSIAVPEYNNIVGEKFIKNFENMNLFKNISENLFYKKDSVSAMESVDLYEVDFAVINSLLLNSVKNSSISYIFPETFQIKNKNNEFLETNKIIYYKFIKNDAPEKLQKFYEFLGNKKVYKLLNKNKELN